MDSALNQFILSLASTPLDRLRTASAVAGLSSFQQLFYSITDRVEFAHESSSSQFVANLGPIEQAGLKPGSLRHKLLRMTEVIGMAGKIGAASPALKIRMHKPVHGKDHKRPGQMRRFEAQEVFQAAVKEEP